MANMLRSITQVGTSEPFKLQAKINSTTAEVGIFSEGILVKEEGPSFGIY